MEAFTLGSDSENRITVGGKRKSSSRRSSILKGSKSPLKCGVLEDLDPNSMDDNGRSKSKKSRRSSGRRVSFAEKNEIKEFLVEDDWFSSSVANTAKKSENDVPNRTTEGVYREPAETIKGLESLLKGDIQADARQIYQAKDQEMSEVRFDETKVDNTVNVDRGIMLQSLGHDRTAVYPGAGSFAPVPTINYQMASGIQVEPAAEEMECTKCYEFGNISRDSSVLADENQTTLFGGHASTAGELDLTCTHQEIFFRDYPTAPLMSPMDNNTDNGVKMDGRSFLMSLGSNSSLIEANQVLQDSSSVSNTGSVQQRRPLGEIIDSKTHSDVDSGVRSSCNAKETPYNPVELDITNCHGYGIIPSKSSFVDDQMAVLDDTCALDLTLCHGQALGFSGSSKMPLGNSELQSSCGTEKKDASGFLRSLGGASKPKAVSTSDKENFVEELFQSQSASVNTTELSAHEQDFQTASLETDAPNGRSFLVGLLTPPKNENNEETTYFSCRENLDLTACHGNAIVDRRMKGARRSLCEISSVDITSCYGPGLIESANKDVADDEGEMDLTESLGSAAYQNHFATDGDVLSSQSMDSRRLETFGKASFGKLMDSYKQKTKRRSCYEPADVDVTCCYGPGLVDSANKDTMEKTGISAEMDLTETHRQKTKRRSCHEPADVDVTCCYGPGLLDSANKGAVDENEISGEMDLTETHGQFAGDTVGSRCKDTQLYSGSQQKEVHALENPDSGNRCGNLQSTCDENLEFTVCHSRNVLDISGQGVYTDNGRLAFPTVSNPQSKCDENLEFTVCHSSDLPYLSGQGVDTDNGRVALMSGQDGCLAVMTGQGLLSSDVQQGEPIESRRIEMESRCDDNLELTACHSQDIVNSSLHVAKRRSIYEPTNVDLTSCFGHGFVKSPNNDDRSCPGDACDIDLVISSGQGTFEGDSMGNTAFARRTVAGVSATDRAIGARDQDTIGTHSIDVLAHHENEPVARSVAGVSATDGAIVAKDQNTIGTHRGIDLLAHHENEPYSAQDVNQISLYKFHMDPTALLRAVTTQAASDKLPRVRNKDADKLTSACEWEKHSSAKARRHSEPAEASVMSIRHVLGNRSLLTTEEINLSLKDQNSVVKTNAVKTRRCSELEEVSGQDDLNNETLCTPEEMNLSLEDPSSILTPSVTNTPSASEPQEVAMLSSHDDLSNKNLFTAEGIDVSSYVQNILINDHATSEQYMVKEEDTKHTSNIAEEVDNSIHYGLEDRDGDGTIADQGTDSPSCRKLSIICEEADSEVNKTGAGDNSLHNLDVQSQQMITGTLTLEEFLDTTEIMFLKEDACIRRNTIIASSNSFVAPTEPKDIVLSSLVDKPKTLCYEETISAIEAEIKRVKERVDEQKKELNANNPQVFGEIQAASKEEALNMRKKLGHLKTVCEKSAKQEWKEGQLRLNKKILSTMMENHQQIAGDVHVTEESLAMVDDCLNLIDKMDKDLEEEIKGLHLSLGAGEKKLQEQMQQDEVIQRTTDALKRSEEELTQLEHQRSSLQSEKDELVCNKEQLEGKVLEHEEAIRLLTNKKPSSSLSAAKDMSQKLDLLESLQEWSLEEWDKDHAKFTFLKGTLEMTVLFGAELGCEGSLRNQEVRNVQLNPCLQDGGSRYYGIVHRLVSLTVNQELLTQMTPSRADLTKVLEHISGIICKARHIGEEVFRIGLSHLMSFKENKLIVEFSSLKAFVKFLVEIQLDVQSYPDSVVFSSLPKIGKYSRPEIEDVLHTVHAGPRYLSRLVEAADQLLI